MDEFLLETEYSEFTDYSCSGCTEVPDYEFYGIRNDDS